MLMRRFGAERLVMTTVVVLLALVTAMFLLTLAGLAGVYVLVALLFPAFACLGSLIPTTAVLALDPHGRIAGTASALMGTLQLGLGAIAISVVSVFFDGTALPMVTAMLVCVTGSFILSTLLIGRPRPRLRTIPDAAEVAVEVPGGLNEI